MHMNGARYSTFFWGFAAILLLPLLNIPPFFSPPDWGKAIVFRLILSALLLLFAWQILSGKQRMPTIAWKSTGGILMCLLVLFLGIFLLATVFSVDPTFSFWGDPQRSGGTLNLIFLTIFAIFLPIAFPERAYWKLFTRCLLAVGTMVSILALFQWQGLFSNIFVVMEGRPTSTMGSSMTLALFLLLLLFLALAMFAGAKSSRSRMIYGACAVLFTFVLFLTETRAALLGLAAGLFFFLGWYPIQQKKYTLILKGLLLAVFLAGGGVFLAANTLPSPPSALKRLQLETLLRDSRFAAWQVTIRALQERLLLGYGPENFSVGFDKHYDPALPGMDRIRTGTLESWWDRAHNLLLDTAMQAGLGAVLVLLAFLGVLLWGLQQVKKLKVPSTPEGLNKQSALFAHGLQAAFISYLVAEFFSFDTFSVQLVLFFLFAFSFHLIANTKTQINSNQHQSAQSARPQTPARPPASSLAGEVGRGASTIGGQALIGVLAIALIWFNVQTAILPLLVNAQVNKAKSLVEQKRCQEAFALMDGTFQIKQSSLRSYVGLTYADMILQCQGQNPALRLQSAQKGRDALDETLRLRPSYTRGWIALGGLTNGILENELATNRDPSRVAQLTQEAMAAFQQALTLGPKRQETYVEWAKTFLVLKDYPGAKQKAKECLNIDPELGACWWQLARAEIFLGNAKNGSAALQTAEAKGYGVKTEQALQQLANAYLAAEDYENLANVYDLLTNSTYSPTNAQYHASFAAVNKILQRNEAARREALAVLLLNPAAKKDVAAFFSALPGCDSENASNQRECYVVSDLLRLYLKEPGAKEHLRKALTPIYPEKTASLNLYINLGPWVKDAAKQYVALDPSNADVRLAFAILLKSFGDPKQAKTEALRAQELDSDIKDIVDLFIQ